MFYLVQVQVQFSGGGHFGLSSECQSVMPQYPDVFYIFETIYEPNLVLLSQNELISYVEICSYVKLLILYRYQYQNLSIVSAPSLSPV